MIRKTIHIQNDSKEDINIDLRHREDAKGAPAIIIIHGFKGFKNFAFFPDLSERLAIAGYVAITPNFSRNGIGYDYNTFENLEKFAKNTISHELNDLQTIINNIKDQNIAKKTIDLERIALMGHSKGGGICILKAAELSDEIKCIVTWGSVNTFERFSKEQIKIWEKGGVVEIENGRTKQMMPINDTFWQDYTKNKARFDILKAAEKLDNPALFIHGDSDETVSPSESEAIHKNCNSYVKRLELVEGASHTFGISHPFNNPTEEYQTACLLTENWFDNYLNI
jgi:dienelactone hydrolase